MSLIRLKTCFKCHEYVPVIENNNINLNQLRNDLCEFLNGNIDGLHKNLRDKYELQRGFIDHLKKGTLKYANEYSLRKKLIFIIKV